MFRLHFPDALPCCLVVGKQQQLVYMFVFIISWYNPLSHWVMFVTFLEKAKVVSLLFRQPSSCFTSYVFWPSCTMYVTHFFTFTNLWRGQCLKNCRMMNNPPISSCSMPINGERSFLYVKIYFPKISRLVLDLSAISLWSWTKIMFCYGRRTTTVANVSLAFLIAYLSFSEDFEVIRIIVKGKVLFRALLKIAAKQNFQ